MATQQDYGQTRSMSQNMGRGRRNDLLASIANDEKIQSLIRDAQLQQSGNEAALGASSHSSIVYYNTHPTQRPRNNNNTYQYYQGVYNNTMQQQQQYYYHQPGPALPVVPYYMHSMMPTTNPHMHTSSFNHNFYYMPANQGRMKKSYSTNTPRRNYSMDGRYYNVQRSGNYDRPGRRDQYYNRHRRSKSRPNQGSGSETEQSELDKNERVVAVNLSKPDGNNQSGTVKANQVNSSSEANQSSKTDSIVFDESLGIVNETEFSGVYERDNQVPSETALDIDESKLATVNLPENLSLKDNEEELKDIDELTVSNPQSAGFLTETEDSEEAQELPSLGVGRRQLETDKNSEEAQKGKDILSDSGLSMSEQENNGIEIGTYGEERPSFVPTDEVDQHVAVKQDTDVSSEMTTSNNPDNCMLVDNSQEKVSLSQIITAEVQEKRSVQTDVEYDEQSETLRGISCEQHHSDGYSLIPQQVTGDELVTTNVEVNNVTNQQADLEKELAHEQDKYDADNMGGVPASEDVAAIEAAFGSQVPQLDAENSISQINEPSNSEDQQTDTFEQRNVHNEHVVPPNNLDEPQQALEFSHINNPQICHTQYEEQLVEQAEENVLHFYNVANMDGFEQGPQSKDDNGHLNNDMNVLDVSQQVPQLQESSRIEGGNQLPKDGVEQQAESEQVGDTETVTESSDFRHDVDVRHGRDDQVEEVNVEEQCKVQDEGNEGDDIVVSSNAGVEMESQVSQMQDTGIDVQDPVSLVVDPSVQHISQTQNEDVVLSSNRVKDCQSEDQQTEQANMKTEQDLQLQQPQPECQNSQNEIKQKVMKKIPAPPPLPPKKIDRSHPGDVFSIAQRFNIPDKPLVPKVTTKTASYLRSESLGVNLGMRRAATMTKSGSTRDVTASSTTLVKTPSVGSSTKSEEEADIACPVQEEENRIQKLMKGWHAGAPVKARALGEEDDVDEEKQPEVEISQRLPERNENISNIRQGWHVGAPVKARNEGEESESDMEQQESANPMENQKPSLPPRNENISSIREKFKAQEQSVLKKNAEQPESSESSNGVKGVVQKFDVPPPKSTKPAKKSFFGSLFKKKGSKTSTGQQ